MMPSSCSKYLFTSLSCLHLNYEGFYFFWDIRHFLHVQSTWFAFTQHLKFLVKQCNMKIASATWQILLYRGVSQRPTQGEKDSKFTLHSKQLTKAGLSPKKKSFSPRRSESTCRSDWANSSISFDVWTPRPWALTFFWPYNYQGKDFSRCSKIQEIMNGYEIYCQNKRLYYSFMSHLSEFPFEDKWEETIGHFGS